MWNWNFVEEKEIDQDAVWTDILNLFTDDNLDVLVDLYNAIYQTGNIPKGLDFSDNL